MWVCVPVSLCVCVSLSLSLFDLSPTLTPSLSLKGLGDVGVDQTSRLGVLHDQGGAQIRSSGESLLGR